MGFDHCHICSQVIAELGPIEKLAQDLVDEPGGEGDTCRPKKRVLDKNGMKGETFAKIR